MDGATDVKAFFYITIPMLKRTTYLIFMLQVIASFKVFGQFWLITKGRPGYQHPTVDPADLSDRI